MNTQTMERPLAQAKITVQYVNPAKAPGKSANIKDTAGQIFSVWPTMLHQFAPGETYNVEFTEKVVNGVVYRDIKHVAPAGGVGPAPTNFVTTEEVVAQRRPQQQQRSAPVQQHVTPPQPNLNYRQPTHPADSRNMFVCSMVNAMITSHQIEMTVEAIARTIKMLGDAYDIGNSNTLR